MNPHVAGSSPAHMGMLAVFSIRQHETACPNAKSRVQPGFHYNVTTPDKTVSYYSADFCCGAPNKAATNGSRVTGPRLTRMA